MVDTAAQDADWTKWRVAPGSGFEVCHAAGRLGLTQISPSQFLVEDAFRYSNPEVQAELQQKLVASGRSPEAALAAVEDARMFTPSDENPTDLASIPRFMRWFENPYGVHTLAAILHDQLITDVASGGVLGSDSLSDRFFRQMLGSAGVPWLKRWIMWSAVALRSRFAAGGARRAMIVLWLIAASCGIGAALNAAGSVLLGWGHVVDVWVLVVVGALLPFASAPLWGKQRGASLVAAVAALWVLPAALLAAFGYLVYRVLESVVRAVGLR